MWIDERGKRCKLPAPQYIDYVMTFTQKTVNDESVFPTKFGKKKMEDLRGRGSWRRILLKSLSLTLSP